MNEYNGVDPQTGVVLDEYLGREDTEKREKKFREKLPKDRQFATLSLDAFRAAKMTTNEMNVLVGLMDLIDARGRVDISLAEIAEMISVARTSAWRITDAMVARDILRRRGRATLYVNPHIMWKGHTADRTAAKLRWLNQMDARKDGRSE